MKDFLLNAILYPLLAILFCLAFGVAFTYHGFQTVEIDGTRDDAGVVTLSFTREHYFGIIQVERELVGVEGATMQTDRVRRANKIGGTRTLVSGVYIYTDEESERLFAGSSNLDEDTKWEAIKSINEFITNEERKEYSQTFRITNVFSWVGLPFLILGIWGLLAWPVSIIRYRD